MNSIDIDKFRTLLRRLERDIFELFRNDARCCGVSMAQCYAIMELGSMGRVTISDLAGRLRLDKSTLSRTVDGLVQQGLFLREISNDDRRYMSIELTQKGEALFRSINDRYNEVFRETLKSVPGNRQEQLLESLDLLVSLMADAKNTDAMLQAGYCCCTPEQENNKK